MSRFIEKITRMRQNEPQPMGFMPGRATSEKPKLQLLTVIPADILDKNFENLKPADAVLVEITKADDLEALEKICRVKDGIPGGGWLKSSAGTTVRKALNSACDLVVFPAATPLSLAQKDKVGRVLELDLSWGDSLLRSISELPVDAVIISSKEIETSLTFNNLMLLQRIVLLVNKPVLVSITDSLNDVEFQALWDMGISGVVVEISDEKSAEKLAELRKAIDKLAPSAARKKGRLSAILPRMQPEAEKPQEEEEEEDE